MEILTALIVAKFKAKLAARATRLAATLVVLIAVVATFGLLMFGGVAAGTAAQSTGSRSGSTCATNTTGAPSLVLAAETLPAPSASVTTGSASGASSSAVPTLGGAPMTAEQIANAAVIVAVGHQMGVPQLGLEAALITAIQESGLRNLSYGDADSVGLFQQRPSMGWGSVAEIMQPDYAAGRFYHALVAIPNYEQQSAPWLAQAVQRSAFPDRYANWTDSALQLLGVAEVGSASCALISSQAGSTFGTGVEQVILPRGNPRSVEQAVAWAQGQATNGSSNWYRACLGFVAQAYGWSFSGTYYAIDQYTSVIPVSMHHDGDRNPPLGALLFWRSSSRAGHVAIYVGDGNVASNDILVNGQISVVPAALIEQKWGATYVGWAPPYFPSGG